MRYEGWFASKEDVCREFDIRDFGGVVLVASYDIDGYYGYANVVFMDGSKLFYVQGSHCSCDGLGGQWIPEEITVEEILHMQTHGTGFWKANSWIGDCLRRIRDEKMATEPDEVLAALILLA